MHFRPHPPHHERHSKTFVTFVRVCQQSSTQTPPLRPFKEVKLGGGSERRFSSLFSSGFAADSGYSRLDEYPAFERTNTVLLSSQRDRTAALIKCTEAKPMLLTSTGHMIHVYRCDATPVYLTQPTPFHVLDLWSPTHFRPWT